MPEIKCPMCGCRDFYLKDPDDEYETFEFHLKEGKIHFDSEEAASHLSEIEQGNQIFCDCCAWRGKLEGLKKQGRH